MTKAPLDPLDPYRAAAQSVVAYTELLGNPLPPEVVRKILMELGFMHPIEARSESSCPGVGYCKAALAGGGDCGKSPCAVSERRKGG